LRYAEKEAQKGKEIKDQGKGKSSSTKNLYQVRNNMLRLRIAALTALIFLLSAFGTAYAANSEFEEPTAGKASNILPAPMITGDHYKIRDAVAADGFMYHFTVDSDYGLFEPVGIHAVRKLIAETKAITVLKKIKKNSLYLEALKKSGMMPVEFAKDLVINPFYTAVSIPKGIYHLFADAATAITTKSNPSQDSAVKAILGVSSYKREMAAKLGVDVYSSNPILQDELNSVGWTGAMGQLTVSAALAPVGGAAVMAVSATRGAQQVRDFLKDTPPERLRQMNEEKLLAMGVSQEVTKKFLDSPFFTPRHQTIIVSDLAAMKEAKGIEAFITRALSASDEETANFFQDMADTMHGYNEKVSPITKISVVSGIIFATSQSGSVLMPFPIDNGVWTEKYATILNAAVTGYKGANPSDSKLELWVRGTVTPLARKNLEALGIKVVEQVEKTIMFMD
jgi:hypothetical protein